MLTEDMQTTLPSSRQFSFLFISDTVSMVPDSTTQINREVEAASDQLPPVAACP